MHEIHRTQVLNINIDAQNLFEFLISRPLYRQLIDYPQEIIPIMDLVVYEEFTRIFGKDSLGGQRIQVRTFNLFALTKMRDLTPSDIGQMIAINGMITRCSGVIPDLKVAFFQCLTCRHTEERMIDRGRIEEPTSCAHCGAKNSMELIHNRCLFTDKQHIKLQEAPENIPEGETPHTVTLFAFDGLVDVGRPGDRIEVTGIFRAVPVRVNPRKRTVKAVYRTYIDVIHLRKARDGQVSVEDPKAEKQSEYHTEFDESDNVEHQAADRQKSLERMSKDPQIYDKLAESIAPSIWELSDVKKGILCQMLGGATKSLANKHLRGEINVLLCGDPGTSKSQMLAYAHKLAPRGIYTSGKGSSAVGLTAYVYKDPETRELTLESGALVLSDRGICCIDEFDKVRQRAAFRARPHNCYPAAPSFT